jgi:hypothetical protein
LIVPDQPIAEKARHAVAKRFLGIEQLNDVTRVGLVRVDGSRGVLHGLYRGLVYASSLPVPLANEENASMLTTAPAVAVCLTLTRAISQARTVGEILPEAN